MASPHDAVASALRAYRPGALEDEYQSMDQKTRQEIANRADEFFSLKTGFYGDIDDEKPGHPMLMRQWLLIRDALIACHVYDEKISQIHEGDAGRLESEISDLRDGLAQSIWDGMSSAGLPRGLNSKLQSVKRTIAECSHVSEMMGIARAIVITGHEAAGLNTGAIGLGTLVFLTAAMDEIGEAREIGGNQTERHAFLHGFASYLVYGRIITPIGGGHRLGRRQLQGEQAAQKMISRLPVRLRDNFLDSYRAQPQRYPSENMDRALHDLGFTW